MNKDGIILINKQISFTSRDVVNIIEKKFRTKKVGHAGTLDPFADGLLILGIEKGTKTLQFLEGYKKTYIATLLLGKTTDTFDTEGKVIDEKTPVLHSNEEISDVLASFLGKIKQIPPIYSALKIKGMKLYEYARKGIEVEIKEREIEIFNIKLISYSNDTLVFEVECSKGTYIRTLAMDIASKLGECGHLINLKRTKIGSFDLTDAKTIDEIEEIDIISIYDSLKDFPTEILNEKKSLDIKNGKKYISNNKDDLIFLVDENKHPLAIYERYKIGEDIFISKRGLF